MKSHQIAFAASAELYDAIAILAYSNRESLAATIRKIVAKELLEYGLFDARAATTEHLAETNAYFLPKKARQALRRPGPLS